MPIAMIPLPCFCATMRRATRAVTQLYDDALRPSGLRITQLTLLQAVSLVPGISPVRLGALLGIDIATLSRTLRPLQRRGWIAIERPADGRERRIRLTRLGRQRLTAAQRTWTRLQSRLRATLGSRRWARLAKELDDLTEAVQASRKRP
jgi:DNA-binding MarR family transcriptional regulator